MRKSSLTKIGISVMIFFGIGASSSCQSDIVKTDNQTVHIYSVNDFHGAACGYGDEDINVSPKNPGILRLADILNDKIKASPNSMIVSVGDNNSGDVFSSSLQGTTIFPILKALDVRYSAVGNHEFDWEKTISSTDGLITNNYLADKKLYDQSARTEKTVGNYFIAANILKNNVEDKENDFYKKTWSYNDNSDYEIWKQNKVEWADPYKIVDLSNLKICLIGLTTVLTRTDGNKLATKDYAFIDYNASVEYAKKLCQEEKHDEFNKIDAFILLTHITSDMDGQNVVGEAQELAQNLTTKVDAIISGHSHKIASGYIKNNKFGNNIWIGQAGSSGRNYLDLELNYSASNQPGKKLLSLKITTPTIKVATTFEEAKQELQSIENKANNSSNQLLNNAVKAFKKQKGIVLENLNKPLFESKNSSDDFELSYPAFGNCDIGHEYYCSEQIVDNAGLWLTKSITDGCNIVNSQLPDNENISNKTKVSTSFLCIDSVRSQLAGMNKITKWDLYQFLTYDNYVLKGWLTISQLWNVMDYALSGGWTNNDKADDKSAFVYGQNNSQYDWIEKIETNCFTGEKELELPEIKISDEKTTKLNYLAGPLQFYGCKIAVKEAPKSDQTVDGRHVRKYIVDYTEEKNDDGQTIKIPVMWLYDPSDEDNDINDSTTWKRVTITGSRYDESKNEWNYLEDLVPVVVDNFTYDGGNYQNTMFKLYMRYNASLSKRYRVYTYPLGDFFTRDFVIKSCEYWNSHKTDSSFDFDKFACKNEKNKMVIFN